MDEITRNKIREALEREFKSHDVKEEVTDSFIDGLVAEVKTDMDSEFTPGAVVNTYNDSIDLLSTEIFDQIKNGGNFKKVDELQQEQNRIRYKLLVFKCMYGENTERLTDSLPDLPYDDELDNNFDSCFDTEKKEEANKSEAFNMDDDLDFCFDTEIEENTEKKEEADLNTILDSDAEFDFLEDDAEPENKNEIDIDNEEDLLESDINNFDNSKDTNGKDEELHFEESDFSFDNKDTDENDEWSDFEKFRSDDAFHSPDFMWNSNDLQACGLDNSYDDTNWSYKAHIENENQLCLNVRQGKHLREQMNIKLQPSKGLETIKEIITDHLFDSLDVEKCVEIIMSLKLNDDGISLTSERLLNELVTAEENIKTLKKLFGFTNKLCD